MHNRDIGYAPEEREQVEPDFIKRQPAVEYGYDSKDSPYAGCVDCYQVFERMLYACYGKEI